VIQVAGCTTVFLLGTFMFLALRKDYRGPTQVSAAAAPPSAEKKA